MAENSITLHNEQNETTKTNERRFRPLRWLRRIMIAGFIAVVVWGLVVAGLSWMIHTAGHTDETQMGDVIVVLGSGLRRNGSPGDALYRRSAWGADLYHQGIAPYVICTGGVGDGQWRSEADACREVMVERGVPENVIHLEESSHSTEENAIYALEILQANEWDEVVLVTDSFHMLRAGWIFQQYDIEHYRSPVPRERVRNFFYRRHFTREIAALHWHAFKTMFNLPVTSFK